MQLIGDVLAVSVAGVVLAAVAGFTQLFSP